MSNKVYVLRIAVVWRTYYFNEALREFYADNEITRICRRVTKEKEGVY